MPSTIEALLDVNVLIASVFEDHPYCEQARKFVQGLEHFYTCPTTQGGFLRFATRPFDCRNPSGANATGGVRRSPH
jgi:predicted nucleic acid-binding protein